MENYYGGPKGLQGIQGNQGEQGFNFLIKGIAQDNTCENMTDILAFIPSVDLPSFEENKWFVYYFNKLEISFGYSKDKNNNIHKIFLGYQHSGFWADSNNIDLLKFSTLENSLQENGNINFNFTESKDLILDYTVNNLNKKIKLLNKYNQNLLTPSNVKVDREGDYCLSVFDKQIDGWTQVKDLSDGNVYYYKKNNSPAKEVTFYLACQDDFLNINNIETYTAYTGNQLSEIATSSEILNMLGINEEVGCYGYETIVEGKRIIFTLNGLTSVDVAWNGALRPSSIVGKSWNGVTFWVTRAQ